ncbi:hypothetical protein Pla22_28870 [Rubripirellula amarantea]|uniref:Uncharacterized protein n=1 Tax=Rubripirellula amarantea TaxID=2527999 RepID=A0A5C5WHV8_9BACT|nr:hypothetical protein Pla22_28870 [Rubripirellula amarantea]
MDTIADLNGDGVDVVGVAVIGVLVVRRADKGQVAAAVDCKVVLVGTADDRIRHRIARHIAIADGDLRDKRNRFVDVDARGCTATVAGDRDGLVIHGIQRDAERACRRGSCSIVDAERKAFRKVLAAVVVVGKPTRTNIGLSERGSDHSVHHQLAVAGRSRHRVDYFAGGVVGIRRFQHCLRNGIARRAFVECRSIVGRDDLFVIDVRHVDCHRIVDRTERGRPASSSHVDG